MTVLVELLAVLRVGHREVVATARECWTTCIHVQLSVTRHVHAVERERERERERKSDDFKFSKRYM